MHLKVCQRTTKPPLANSNLRRPWRPAEGEASLLVRGPIVERGGRLQWFQPRRQTPNPVTLESNRQLALSCSLRHAGKGCRLKVQSLPRALRGVATASDYVVQLDHTHRLPLTAYRRPSSSSKAPHPPAHRVIGLRQRIIRRSELAPQEERAVRGACCTTCRLYRCHQPRLAGQSVGWLVRSLSSICRAAHP